MVLSVDFRLYLITDRKVATKPLPEAVRLALEGGVRAIQLREKDLPVRELLAMARELRSITREFGAKLFVNDRVDVAMIVGADGVHLGNASMPVEAVRKIVGTKMLVGVSTHSVEEAIAAQAGDADFITLGPIFETPSKSKYGSPVGLDIINEVKNEINIPIFAIGGINSGNIKQIITSGASGFAVISSILAASDIKSAAAMSMKASAIMDKYKCEECSPR